MILPLAKHRAIPNAITFVTKLRVLQINSWLDSSTDCRSMGVLQSDWSRSIWSTGVLQSNSWLCHSIDYWTIWVTMINTINWCCSEQMLIVSINCCSYWLIRINMTNRCSSEHVLMVYIYWLLTDKLIYRYPPLGWISRNFPEILWTASLQSNSERKCLGVW